MSNGNNIEPSPIGADLDFVALRLNEICRSASINLAFRIGEFVIQQLFANDATSWHSGAANPSFRALAARGDLPMGPSALCRAVSIYALIARLGGREHWTRLRASHFQEVLPLDLPMQRQLLLSAEAEGWTVARLRAEVAVLDTHRRHTHKVGRLDRAIRAIAKRLATEIETVDQWPDYELDNTALAEAHSAISLVYERLAELEARLGYRVAQLRHSDIVELAPDARASSK